MKKIFYILSVLTITLPTLSDELSTPVSGDATHADPATLSNAQPGYGLVNSDTVRDRYHASTGYVKGAYNSAIKAVNTVHSLKQDKLDSTGNNPNLVYTTNTSGAPIVTNVSASGGTVTVTKGEITIPVGSPTNPTYHTTIWLK